MPRLFVAIDVPRDIRSQVAGVLRVLKSTGADVRWEREEKLHMTLKFLGETKDELIPAVLSSLEQLAGTTAPFSVSYASLGCFPGKREPRIIWIGVHEVGGVLQSLARAVDAAMAGLGFEREDRPFHPHVTIGRVKSRRATRDLIRTMESITFQSQPTTIAELSLVKSELQPSGSVYTTLKTVTFSTNTV